MSMCSYCTFSNSNHTMRLYCVSDIRTDNYFVVSGRSTAEISAPFFIHEEWTAYLSESLYKDSNLLHIRLVLPYLIEIPSMPLQSKIGACGVSLFTDFKSGNYRWGYVRSGSNLLPENSGYCPGGSALQGYISNRTFKRSRAALCFGNGYSGERLIREWEGSSQAAFTTTLQ